MEIDAILDELLNNIHLCICGVIVVLVIYLLKEVNDE